MKKIFFFTILLIALVSCRSNNVKTVASKAAVSEPQRVLDSIVILAKNHSLYRKNVDWDTLEKEVYSRYTNSDSITAIIEPVQYLLHELGDYHGFLFLNKQRYGGNITRTRDVSYDYKGEGYTGKMSAIYQKTVSQDSINGWITEDHLAYVEIPLIMPYGGNGTDVIENTQMIRNKICQLKAEHPKGWIIDVRGNLGGSMYPMLMGLADILPSKMNMGGDSEDGMSISQKWTMTNGVFYYGENSYPNIPKLTCQSQQESSNIAVLIGRYTASSGEVVACALKGQEGIRLFGEQTSGATTSLNWFTIGEEVVFNAATSYYASKDQSIHFDGIIPDVIIDEDFDFENPARGEVYAQSVKWLLSRE